MEYSDKVVVITGASSGIGASCAVHFAKLSAKLSLVGRNAENLIKVASQCENLNGLSPTVIIADVKSEEDIDRIISETVASFGKIDVLVNNAGACLLASIEQGIGAYDYVMETNVRSTFLLTSKCIPHLVKTKGNIVNVSSILSTRPLSSMSAYCMSKAAIDMFTKCAALEVGTKGVRVNSVNPGAVKTNLFISAGLGEAENEKFFQYYENVSPMRKVTQPEDVASLVVYLASDKAKCITGSNFIVDCGALISEGNTSS